MTVRRHSENFFRIAPPAVANAIRTVLARRPPYNRTAEIAKDTLFKVNVKPSWFLLGTTMTVQLHPEDDGTRVITDIKSQFYIMGDIYNFYNRYIYEFLHDLRSELQRIELQKLGVRV